MPELFHEDVTLHYELDGDGPPLILIPGMLSDSASWFPVVDALAGHFTLIRPDLLGAGRTRPYDAPITLDTLAGDVLALADHLGHPRFAVAGHSLGGLVALRLAGLAPERLSALVAMASTPQPSGHLPHLFQTLCRIRATDDGERLWYNALFPWLFHDDFFRDPKAVAAAAQASIDYPHAQPLSAMAHQIEALGQLRLRDLPRHLDISALALLAEADAMIAEQPARAAWEGLGAEVRTIAKTGHSLHWDQPEVAATAISQFVLNHIA